MLRVLLKAQCEEHNVARVVVANDEDLKRIAHFSEEDLKGNNDIRAMQGWRLKVFGEAALKLKRGELALTGTSKKVQVITLEGVKVPAEKKATAKPRNRK